MIGVVHGGYSTERGFSTTNATYINESLKRRGYDTVMIEYDSDLANNLLKNRVDIVYLCVQGKGHGDGTLQGILDYLRIPYTGSDMTSAALINNKIFCKELFKFNGIPTPDWSELRLRDYKMGNFDASKLKYPLVSKATSQGAGYGIELINDESEFCKVEKSFAFDEVIFLESFVRGPFYTVGLLEKGGEVIPLPCIEVIDEQVGRDELKLFAGEYKAVSPDISKDFQKLMQSFAVKTFEALHCRDYARVDLMMDEDTGDIYVLEINAVPGLQPDSFFPHEANLAGIDYDDLIEGILQNARRRNNV